MVTRAEWYSRVNAAWPSDLPIPTEQQAINAVRRLWRWGMGETWKGSIEVTSGRRYTWARGGVLYVNPNRTGWSERGWKALVHDLSHLMWRRANPGSRPHEREHAKLELRMVKEVVRRGWLEPEKPKAPEPVKIAPDPKIIKYQRIKDRMARWEAKQKRAARALAKLKRSAAYYERIGLTLH